MSALERDNAATGQGYTYEGVAGYLYTSTSAQSCGGRPFYRLYSSRASDHFYTTSDDEKIRSIVNLGFTDEGVAGYLPA
ncbi:hypothetical protein MD484_g8888, partial [Candolleomyces efflorescens]